MSMTGKETKMKKPYRWKINSLHFGRWVVLAVGLLLLAGLVLLGCGLTKAGWIVTGAGLAVLLGFLLLLGLEQHQDSEMNRWKR